MKRILVIVDNPTRDLRGLSLVGLELASRGYQIYFTSHNISSIEIWKIAPHFILLNYMRSNSKKLITDLINSNINYAILDTEGGLFDDYNIFLSGLSKNRFHWKNCSGYFSWGTKIKEVLIANDLLAMDKIFLTGQPRMDIYHEKFNSILLHSHPDSFNFNNYILINGTFSFSKPKYSTPEEELLNANKIFGIEKDYAKKMQSTEKIVFPNLMKMIRELALDHPNEVFIYRPHPFENSEFARLELNNIQNVRVIDKGPVDGWLLKCKLLIQLNCSTAFEASFIGKPVFTPDFLGESLGDPRVRKISHIIKTYDELSTIIANLATYQRPKELTLNLSTYISEVFFKIDGNSHMRCANAIESIIQNSKNTVNLQICKENLNRPEFEDKSMLKAGLRRLIFVLGLSRHFKFGKPHFIEMKHLQKWKKSAKYFDIDQVVQITEGIKTVVPEWENVEVSLAQSILDSSKLYSIKLERR